MAALAGFSLPLVGFPIVLATATSIAAQDVRTVRLPSPDRIATVEELGPAARFEGVIAVRELSDGTVLVADREAWRLVRVDWDAREARAFTSPSRLGTSNQPLRLFPLGADSTLWTSGSSREWAILEDTIAVRHFDRDAGLGAIFGGAIDGSDREGRVLGTSLRYPYTREAGLEPADTLVLLLGRPDEAVIDTIARLRGPAQFPHGGLSGVPYGDGFLYLGHPYTTEEMARLFPDGWIAVARMDPYRVDWRSPDGRWILGDPLPFSAKRVDEVERCFVIEAVLGECKFVDRFDWPDVVPPFGHRDDYGGERIRRPALLAMPEGTLLVRRTRISTRPERQYDIVDRRGDLIGRVALPLNVAIVGFGEFSVYTVEAGDSGSETLRRHPWRGSGP